MSTITAEFENFDYAEAAAREIKRKIDGIKKISISVNSYENYQQTVYPYGGTGISSPGVTGSLFPYNLGYASYDLSGMGNYSPNFSDNNSYYEHEEQTLSKININCEKESEHDIIQLLTSMGGLKIKKV